MKNFILSAVAFMVIAFTSAAQEYKSRVPFPNEINKIAGVDWWPSDGPIANVTMFLASSNYDIVTLQDTNSFVWVVSQAPTNVYVILPNCTNHTRKVYDLVATERTTLILTNANQQTFVSNTNALVAQSIFTTRTNSIVHLYSSGTNWIVLSDIGY